MKTCPICGKEYEAVPAISRRDGKTEICPVCGVHEALEAAGIESKETVDLVEEKYSS